MALSLLETKSSKIYYGIDAPVDVANYKLMCPQSLWARQLITSCYKKKI
jgi:hypothetical protein